MCLLAPVQLGALKLSNGIVMAPMTRSRAGEGDVPTDVMAEYYAQRASAGMIITEGTHPSAEGKGYCRSPGIFNEEQIDAWRQVVEGVHAKGGTIVMQMMHCGRIGHPDNKAPGTRNVAPSAIAPEVQIFTEQGMQDVPSPHALTIEEIKSVIEEYAQATRNAFAAGFDGVELHCTSGYLPAQFLSTGTNTREDAYGGSLENRLRFVTEVLAAMVAVNGADRVGIRICPGNPFNDLSDDNPEETFEALLQAISPLGLAYLHAIRATGHGIDVVDMAKKYFDGPLILNDSFDATSANTAVECGDAQAISFGRSYIANPDLVDRITHGYPLADFAPELLYTPGPAGYTSYSEYQKDE